MNALFASTAKFIAVGEDVVAHAPQTGAPGATGGPPGGMHGTQAADFKRKIAAIAGGERL